MFTASHNPARYNGIKLCLAVPLSLDTGLERIRDDAQALLDGDLTRPAGSATGPWTATPQSTTSTG